MLNTHHHPTRTPFDTPTRTYAQMTATSTPPLQSTLDTLMARHLSGVTPTSAACTETVDEDGFQYGVWRGTMVPTAILKISSLDAVASAASQAPQLSRSIFEWVAHNCWLEPGRVQLAWRTRSLKRSRLPHVYEDHDSDQEQVHGHADDRETSSLSPWQLELLRIEGALTFVSATEACVVAHVDRVTLETLRRFVGVSKVGTEASVTRDGERLEVLLRHNAFDPVPLHSAHKRHCASAFDVSWGAGSR